MRRTAVLAALILLLVWLSGCPSGLNPGNPAAEGEKVPPAAPEAVPDAPSTADSAEADIVIDEFFFAGRLNDIFTNLNDYTGKSVRYEGFVYRLEAGAPAPFAVVRRYYCCGPDAYLVGLPCQYSGEIPGNDAWVEVTGVLAKEEDETGEFPVLQVTGLTVQETRGEDTVYQ